MIRVNLLPEDKRKRVKKRRAPRGAPRDIPVALIIVGLLAVVVTCIVLGLWQWTLNKKSASLEEQIASIDRQIKSLDVDIRKVKEFKGQKQDLESKLNIILQLQNKKRGPVHFLDQLAKAIPLGLWLQEVSENGSAMTVMGMAMESGQISTFMKNLEKSEFFSGVDLSSVQSAVKNKRGATGSTLKSFQLTSNIHTPKNLK